MQEVLNEFNATFEVKQSKFLSYLIPIASLDEKLELLKSEHPKARHFIVAWRKINAFEQTVEYSTDDGEPKGTSGRPVLNVLRGSELINSAVIIVRYFGGTKLGTGGLVRAYSQAAKDVIQVATLEAFELKYPLNLTVSYAHNPRLEHLLQSQNIKVCNKAFMTATIEYLLDVTVEQKEQLLEYEKLESLINIIQK